MQISLSKAYQLLMSGQVVAVPTETVYGLAASIERPAAIDQIFTLKGRPSNNPLIIHIAKTEQILAYTHSFPKDFMNLAKTFWPGPLTMILPIDPASVPVRACAGLPTAAFRIPHHSLTLALLEWVGPLVMPSANLSGKPSATRREHVEADFGKEFPVVDGGVCGHGVESTIIHYSEKCWQIARLGAIPAEAFESVLGYIPEKVNGDRGTHPICPGQLYRHYAPKARLNLCSDWEQCQGIVLGFSERHYTKARRVLTMGTISCPEQVAESLYALLRQLDVEGIEEACVDLDFPRNGLWATIAERLSKAALHVPLSSEENRVP